MPIERTHQYTSPEVLSIVDIGGPLVSFPLGAFPNLRSLAIHESYNNLENASIPGGTNLSMCQTRAYRNSRGKCERVALTPTLRIQKLYPVKLASHCQEMARTCPLHQHHLPSTSSMNLSHTGFSCLRESQICHHHVECFPDNSSLPTSLDQLYIGIFQI